MSRNESRCEAAEDAAYEARQARQEAKWAKERADEGINYTRTEVEGLNQSIHQSDELIAELTRDVLQLHKDFAKFRADWEAGKK